MITADSIRSFTPSHPFSAIISGSSKSGKTQLATKLLKNFKFLTGRDITKLSLLYSQWQPAYEEMIRVVNESAIIETGKILPESNDELPEAQFAGVGEGNGKYRAFSKINEIPNSNETRVVIIDDLVHNVKRNDFVQRLFSIQSHHSKITVILILQVNFI